jgi:hypothetical protein
VESLVPLCECEGRDESVDASEREEEAETREDKDGVGETVLHADEEKLAEKVTQVDGELIIEAEDAEDLEACAESEDVRDSVERLETLGDFDSEDDDESVPERAAVRLALTLEVAEKGAEGEREMREEAEVDTDAVAVSAGDWVGLSAPVELPLAVARGERLALPERGGLRLFDGEEVEEDEACREREADEDLEALVVRLSAPDAEDPRVWVDASE